MASKTQRPVKQLSLPAYSHISRRSAVLADLLAGDEAWTYANERGPLVQETGFTFLHGYDRVRAQPHRFDG